MRPRDPDHNPLQQHFDGELAARARVSKRINPGSAGSLRHSRRFDSALVCVRYRKDEGFSYVTVELVVEQRPNPRTDSQPPKVKNPTPPPPAGVSGPARGNAPLGIFIRLNPTELGLLADLGARGARWHTARRAWWVPEDAAEALELFPRAIPPEAPAMPGRATAGSAVDVSRD